MIEPGTAFDLAACGEVFTGTVLTRRQQRQLVALVTKASKLETSPESLSALYDIADQIIEICIPTESEAIKDGLQVRDALDVAGASLVAHVLNGTVKKKSESQPISEKASSAEPATLDV